MQQVWHFMEGVAPEADKAIKQMADWLRSIFGYKLAYKNMELS